MEHVVWLKWIPIFEYGCHTLGFCAGSPGVGDLSYQQYYLSSLSHHLA